MKMRGLFLTIATFALFLGTNVMGQLTNTGTMVAPTGINATDTVTIGSTLPYRVTGDINMHALRTLGILNYSQFTKNVSAGGTLHNDAGTGSPAAIDTAFSVAWSALGTQSIDVTEVPQVISGPAFSCTANTETLPVFVVARPVAAWNGTASASGCNVAGTTITIPYRLTGTGRFDVEYNILYTPLTGAPSQVVALGTDVTALGGQSNGSQDFNFSYAVPATAYGRYDVTIETISDRISRKSGVPSQATDVPAVLTFYAYPTPVTQPINHIQNL